MPKKGKGPSVWWHINITACNVSSAVMLRNLRQVIKSVYLMYRGSSSKKTVNVMYVGLFRNEMNHIHTCAQDVKTFLIQLWHFDLLTLYGLKSACDTLFIQCSVIEELGQHVRGLLTITDMTYLSVAHCSKTAPSVIHLCHMLEVKGKSDMSNLYQYCWILQTEGPVSFQFWASLLKL